MLVRLMGLVEGVGPTPWLFVVHVEVLLDVGREGFK